jgi:hypothetical protein
MGAILAIVIAAIMLVAPARAIAAPGSPPAPKLPYALDWIGTGGGYSEATIQAVPAIGTPLPVLPRDDEPARVIAAVASDIAPEQRLASFVTIASKEHVPAPAPIRPGEAARAPTQASTPTLR